MTQLFTKTLKQAPADQESLNGRLLTRAGFIYQETSGVYTFLPLGLRVLRKIEQIVREEMDAIGGQEMLMTTLAPKELWEATGRAESVDVLFKAMGANKKSVLQNDKDYIVNPTHEEIITPIAQSYVFSYKDLPLLPYHIQTKFRNEARARGGLLRAREFRMKDLYSFHADQAGFTKFYHEISLAYQKIFNRLGLGDKTYYTAASGGDYTEKHSHEFQTVMPDGQDTIYICKNCQSPYGAGLAYNKEVVLPAGSPDGARPDSSSFRCEQCGKSDFRVERATEVGNIFPLETRFSKAFNFLVTDQNGSQFYPVMGSYGIGPSRLLGTLAEVFADDKGIAWPEAVAPFKVQLIDLTKEDGRDEALKVYDLLSKSGVEVLFDDRNDVTAGVKFADADLIGCPWQVLVSTKSLAAGGVEIRSRGEKQGRVVKVEQAISAMR